VERGGHGLAAGLINIPGINALGVNFSDGPGQGVFADSRSQLAAPLRNQLFGIVQADDATLGIQNHGRRYHRAEQGPAPSFIQAGDARPAQFSGRAFETRATHASHGGRADSSMQPRW
jgi:hypothetical protein